MPFGLAAAPLDQVNLGAMVPWTPGPTGSSAPPAPAPQSSAPPVAPAAQPSWWDIAQGMIFDGQSPAAAAMAARQRNYQAQTLQQLPQLLSQLPPGVRAAALMGGPKVWDELAKNWSPQTRSAGQTTDYFGGQDQPGGYTKGTDTFSVDDKSGAPISIGPQGGFQRLGQSLGGDFSAKEGLITSGRTGEVAGRYGLPQLKPLGSSLESFLPGYAGAGGASGITADGGAGPTPAKTPDSGAPRGIRNLNFGNVRALPNGQVWDGQTGVDADGYAMFGDATAGAKAALTNLQSYAKRGVNTPMGIANRWAPAGDGKNDPVAYGHFLAGQLGVGPNDQINLGDEKVQKQVLKGIFAFENGPGAMAAWRAPARPGAAPQTQAGGAASEIHTLSGAQTPQIVPPSDPVYSRFPPGTTLQRAPTGELSVVQRPEYDPAAKSTIRDKVLGSPEYTQAKNAMSAYQAMVANADKMTGPSAYSMLDTFARAINPGAVARPTVIETIEKNLGLPAQLVGSLESKFGQGNLPPQVRQQIIDAVVPFAQAHWDQANMLNRANAALAKQHGFDPSDVTGPLESRPERVQIATPPPAQRHPGTIYITPKGPLRWTGQGAKPWQALQ